MNTHSGYQKVFTLSRNDHSRSAGKGVHVKGVHVRLDCALLTYRIVDLKPTKSVDYANGDVFAPWRSVAAGRLSELARRLLSHLFCTIIPIRQLCHARRGHHNTLKPLSCSNLFIWYELGRLVFFTALLASLNDAKV